MYSSCKVMVSSSGNLKEIRADLDNEGKEHFTFLDSYGNVVSMECVLAVVGLQAFATAKKLSFSDYLVQLEDQIESWKKQDESKDVVKVEPAEQPKIEEPVVEPKKEEQNVVGS